MITAWWRDTLAWSRCSSTSGARPIRTLPSLGSGTSRAAVSVNTTTYGGGATPPPADSSRRSSTSVSTGSCGSSRTTRTIIPVDRARRHDPPPRLGVLDELVVGEVTGIRKHGHLGRDGLHQAAGEGQHRGAPLRADLPAVQVRRRPHLRRLDQDGVIDPADRAEVGPCRGATPDAVSDETDQHVVPVRGECRDVATVAD